jgi:hypothetical protein
MSDQQIQTRNTFCKLQGFFKPPTKNSESTSRATGRHLLLSQLPTIPGRTMRAKLNTMHSRKHPLLSKEENLAALIELKYKTCLQQGLLD